MKKYWITRGVPVAALLIVVAFGMMSCSTDPMSSPDNGSASVNLETAGTVPAESPIMETPEEIRLSGHIRLDLTGECWFLVVNWNEVYELVVPGRLRAEESGRQVSVDGHFPTGQQARCSEYTVFKARKIRFES